MDNAQLQEDVKRLRDGGVPQEYILAYIQDQRQQNPDVLYNSENRHFLPGSIPMDQPGGGGRSQAAQMLLNAAKNLPGSAANLASDFGSMIAHPIESAKNIGRLGLGTAQQLIPGEQGHEQYFDDMVNYYQGRYGGGAAIANTFQTDPLGLFADVASLGTGGGGVLRGAARGARALGATGAADALLNVSNGAIRLANAVDPLNAVQAGARLTGNGINAGIKLGNGGMNLPEAVYISSLRPKPSVASTPGERLALARAGLSEGIAPTWRGYQKFKDRLKELGQTIHSTLENSPNRQVRVDTDPIAMQALDETLPKYRSVARRDAFGQIENVIDQFIEDYPNPLDLLEAQDLKTTTYNVIDAPNYDAGGLLAANTETQKALARGLKEAIAQIEPTVAPLNDRYGALAELRKPLKDAMNRSRSPFSPSTALPAIVGSTALGPVIGPVLGATVGGLVGQTLRNPGTRAQMAFGLDNLGNWMQQPHPLLKYGLWRPALATAQTQAENWLGSR